jgi:hypothetical protein
MNETRDQRIKGDLAELRGQLQSDLVVVMDSRRTLAYADTPSDRLVAEAEISTKEKALWAKLDAIDLLLKK